MSSSPPHGRFASNAAEAEAGAQLRLSPAAESGKTEEFDQGDESLGTDVDGPFSQYCTDNATVWKLYMDQARISDDNLANIFNSDLDPLLIFAGLFSAILSAFLIEVRKGLQEDLQHTTNTLLMLLIDNEQNSTGLTPSSSRFEPSLSLRWVNGLWFSSLMFSLMSALGASLAKGWVTQFSSSVSGSSWGDAAVHCSRWRGLKRWHLKLIIQSLPIPIHIAFFLFSVGLIILIFQDDTVIGVVIFALTAFIVLLYIGSSIHPAYSSDSPFRTPVSWLLRHLLTGSWHLEPVYGFPSQKDSQKAQALAWLLMESPSADTITAAVRAIAGLPTNLFVQDELLRGPTVHPLLRMLSIELAKGRPEPLVLSSCLYTLLHLVQAVSTDPGDESSSALRASIKPGGPLFSTDLFPSDVREIGICVKARIMLLLCDRTSEATLFNTDIPVLIKSSANDHLRRLLFEVEVLMQPHGKLTATESGNDFLSILRDRNALNRNETHDKVVKAAMLERRLNDSVSQFGARTLLKGVATGSTELRRKYARLFAELATHGAFRTEMLNIGSESEICSLLKAEDDEVHEYIAVALIHFSADDNTRKMVTQGLPAVIINCLPNEAPRIIRFLVQVTSYDDVRAGVTAELLVHYLLGLIGGSPPVNADARDSVLTLAQYEDIRAAISTSITTQKTMLMLQHADPCVRYWTLEIIIGLAQYDDLRDQILMQSNLRKIIDMLKDSDPEVQKSALRAVAVLVPYDDARVIATPQTMDSIAAMQHSFDSHVHLSTLQAFAALLQHADIRTTHLTLDIVNRIIVLISNAKLDFQESVSVIVTSLLQHADVRTGIVHEIVRMLGNASPNVRYSALDSLCTLVKHDDFRAEISTPARIHLITDMLWDSKPALRESGLKTVCTLISFGDVSTGINTPQIIHQVAAMLEDSEPGVRKHALAAVPGFIPFDDKHAMSAPQALQNIAGMIDNSGLRLSSHKALAALLQHEHVRMVDLAREIRHRVVSTLGEAGLDVNLPLLRNDAIRTALLNEIDLMLGITDSEQRIRFGALEGIIALVKDDEFRGEISTQTICKIADMIDDSNTSVRISALRAVIALVPYAEISATILTPQTIAKITAGLEDSAGAVKKTALKAVAALLPFDDFRVILTFQNFQHILKLLRTSHSHKPGSLMFTYGVDLLNHHSSRALVSSRNSLVYVLDMLNGSPEDDGILLFMKSFIANYNDITPIGYILTQEILLRIVGANPNVRKSYIQITMMLNFSRIPMASDDTQQLMCMLHNSDPDIVQSAAVIMGTVIANDECRQTATRSGLGRMTLKLIQHLRTAISGLELIRAFAKYDDTLHALTDSPGVVHQLLSMLKSGTTDIDRWEVGVKGLLALGLL